MSELRFTLSVDDGHPLDLRLAGLLDRLGLQATFYVPAANDEGPPVMQPAELRVLAQRFEIGSHTRSHRLLTRLDHAGARAQVNDGKQMLEDWLGRPVQGFCYPGGRYRGAHVALVREAGFTYARTTRNLRIDVGHRPFEVPTTLQFYPHPRAVLVRNFLSQGDWSARLPGLREALAGGDWLQRLYRLFEFAARRRGAFHLWCHALDLERLQLWEALERFLSHVAARVPPAGRLSNAALLSAPPAVPPPAATVAPDPDRRPSPDGAR